MDRAWLSRSNSESVDLSWDSRPWDWRYATCTTLTSALSERSENANNDSGKARAIPPKAFRPSSFSGYSFPLGVDLALITNRRAVKAFDFSALERLLRTPHGKLIAVDRPFEDVRVTSRMAHRHADKGDAKTER